MARLLPCILFLGISTTIWAVDGDEGWISLFDGRSLAGWKVGSHAESFRVEDGMIVANGATAHLFYDGPVGNHDFANFHLAAEVLTFPHANSGIYLHTRYQAEGWPKVGIECQINNSHADWRRTGSLWGVSDIREALVQDGVWYTQELIVQGRRMEVRLNGRQVLAYTLPAEAVDGYVLPTTMTWQSHGTVALQSHDPGSKTCFRTIRIKLLD